MDEQIAKIAGNDWFTITSWIDDSVERAHFLYSHAILNDDAELLERLISAYPAHVMMLPREFWVYAESPLFPRFLDENLSLDIEEFLERYSMRDPSVFAEAMSCFPQTTSAWRYLIADGLCVGGAAVVDALGPNFDLETLFDYAYRQRGHAAYSNAELDMLAQAFTYIKQLGTNPRKDVEVLVNHIIRGDYAAYRELTGDE